MPSFPFDVWGEVRGAPDGLERIMVVEAEGGAYLILTVENGSHYDTWLETLEDVEAYVRELVVEWAAPVSEATEGESM
jgi:hypothetical protein